MINIAVNVSGKVGSCKCLMYEYIKFGPGAGIESGAAARYGSGSTKMMLRHTGLRK
jgi:hypothetical protein